MVYPNGMLQMQGNYPVYQQAATVTIGGTQPMLSTPARLDEKTGELIMEKRGLILLVGSTAVVTSSDFWFVWAGSSAKPYLTDLTRGLWGFVPRLDCL